VIVTVVLLMLGAEAVWAGTPGKGVFFEPGNAVRYRELYTGSELFADLRRQMDTVDRARERAFIRSGVRFNDHLYDIDRIGRVAQQMALVYLYTGDADAASLARECVETLMKFPKWDYFLEGGTEIIGLQRAPNSAIAVAITVEALGDLIPLPARKGWLKTMAERGIEPCYRSTYGMRHPDRVKGWSIDTASTYLSHRPYDRGLNLARWPIILNTINLKAVPASALALSALVYRDYFGESDDTKRWLEQAVYSVGTFRDIYAPDGSYNEGVSYAHYTTLHLIQAIDALQRAGVADLTDLLNWNGYQDYLFGMSLPTKDDPRAIVNFSDAGGGGSASTSFWIARQTRDGMARWFGENLAAGRDIWSVLYFDPSVPSTPPSPGPRLWVSDLGWAVGRTGYAPADLVVAMRSGPPYNHEHADRNSVIVKCFGEKLVVDPMRPPYSYRDPSWKMRLTGGHSAVLIDGVGHQYVDGHEGTNASQAEARVIRRGERPGYFFWASDATQAYKLVIPDVRSITRTVVALTTFPAVVIIDKVMKETTPSRIQARFYAHNVDDRGSATASREGFSILRPHARLIGSAASGYGLQYAAAVPEIPPAVARLHPYVDVGTEKPATDVCLVTVLLMSPSGASPGKAEVVRDRSTYTVRCTAESRSIMVKVFDSGSVPEFEVVRSER
jgi:hypothetical protein